MRVNIEEIWKNVNQRAKWNATPLSEIEFYERGVKIEIDPLIVSHFERTGLNNFDIITSGYYKRKVDEL